MPIWKASVSIAHPSLGGLGSNTFHVRTTGPTSSDDSLQLGNLKDILQTFYETLNSVLATSTVITFDGVWYTVGEAEPATEDSDPFTVGITGAAGVLPPANCVVVGWRTSSPTRGGRGRTFLGPLKLDTLEANGTPDEADLVVIRGAADALVASSMGLANGAFGVYTTDPSGAPPAPQLRDFVGASVKNKFAVLRSRRD